MAPPVITDGTEIRIDISPKQVLRVRSLTPKTKSDFVASSSGGQNQDQGILSQNTSARITESEFYVSRTKIKSFGPGGNVFIKDSAAQPVVLVQLESKTNAV
jgi:hypothetical protein